ncbi:hypothetical protein ACJ41O_014591 [Fusarium nematophilum]
MPFCSPRYQYSPLSPSEKTFRLIKLLPAQPSYIPFASSPLRIEIIETSLDSGISYDALSYTWGVPKHITTPNRRIIVETKDGPRELLIFKPLELALIHLARNNGISPYLFVDQICINQVDDAEKSHQVGLMRHIYSRCTKVVIWLGPSTRSSRQYFDLVREMMTEGVLSRVIGPRLAQFMNVFDAVMDPSREVTETEREDRDDILDMLSRYGHRFPIAGLQDVLQRSWFNRLWVIQEACLPIEIVFVCGDQQLCFDCFRCGVLFYNIYNTHWMQHLDHAVSQSELRLRASIFDLTGGLMRLVKERKAIHQSGTRQAMWDIILRYNVNDIHPKIQASLEEDRLFGLLGLAAEDDAAQQGIRVDYSAVDKVYSRVAAMFLKDNVDVLLFSQFPKATGGLPSWVPDWAMHLKVPYGYADLTEPVFAAGGDKDGREVDFDTSERATLRGILIDRIARVGRRTHRQDPERQIMDQIDYRWAKLYFDEASEFAQEAVAIRKHGNAPALDEPSPTDMALRLSDSGLTCRHCVGIYGATPGLERFRGLHDIISRIGQGLLNSDAKIHAYHITRIIRSTGIVPWYWVPSSEVDALRLCAVKPISAAKLWLHGLYDFVTDMAMVVISSARVAYAAWYIKMRHRFAKVQLKTTEEAHERHGLDPELSKSPEMNVFITNLIKNTGRRLYLTERGYVGTGPVEMLRGDSVVVFHGGSTAHVVRDAGETVWSYLGEAYCDGMMDGEALKLEGPGGGRLFVLG